VAATDARSPTGGPLAGVRVVDCSTVLAGPLACQLLADFGADVIKVEHPRAGDPLRSHGAAKDGVGLWWTQVGRGKRTVGLYLGDPEGAEVFLELVRHADVLVENFRPGTLERWGLGPDVLAEVNPGLVVVRVTGFGQEGPYSGRPGFGTLAEAMSGFAAVTGEPDGPPTLPPFGLADSVAGISGALSAVLALYHRDARQGTGQVVDLAILEPIITVLGHQATVHQQLGTVQRREGNRSRNNAPRNAYRTSDGQWVAVSASATSVAERIVKLVGREDLVDQPWFASGTSRAEHPEIDEAVSAWIAERDRDEVLAAFEAAEAAVAPVYDAAGLVADPHVQHRGTFVEVEHPVLGPLLQQNVLFRMSATPGRVPAPGRELGQDTDEVLVGELGLDPDRVARLRERGVVG
jgi:crotonobetainyl-CoA:carnitine CoA-transferase CaiB-like acyl-CoA transferase